VVKVAVSRKLTISKQIFNVRRTPPASPCSVSIRIAVHNCTWSSFDSSDQGVDHRGQLVERSNGDCSLPLLELDWLDA
jgi:hypothetical protein